MEGCPARSGQTRCVAGNGARRPAAAPRQRDLMRPRPAAAQRPCGRSGPERRSTRTRTGMRGPGRIDRLADDGNLRAGRRQPGSTGRRRPGSRQRPPGPPRTPGPPTPNPPGAPAPRRAQPPVSASWAASYYLNGTTDRCGGKPLADISWPPGPTLGRRTACARPERETRPQSEGGTARRKRAASPTPWRRTGYLPFSGSRQTPGVRGQ